MEPGTQWSRGVEGWRLTIRGKGAADEGRATGGGPPGRVGGACLGHDLQVLLRLQRAPVDPDVQVDATAPRQPRGGGSNGGRERCWGNAARRKRGDDTAGSGWGSSGQTQQRLPSAIVLLPPPPQIKTQSLWGPWARARRSRSSWASPVKECATPPFRWGRCERMTRAKSPPVLGAPPRGGGEGQGGGRGDGAVWRAVWRVKAWNPRPYPKGPPEQPNVSQR